MKQKLEDALRRLDGRAKTLVAKDDVATVRAALLDHGRYTCPNCETLFQENEAGELLWSATFGHVDSTKVQP